jgi:hypothetical protein
MRSYITTGGIMSDQPTNEQVNLETIIGKYIDLRDSVERLMKKAAEEAAPMTAAMKGIETYLMSVANATGQTKFGTKRGTAFQTTKTACNVADWDTTLPWIVEGGRWNLLNKAVNKTAVGEYIERNGTPPPGINWVVMKDIQIRRA